MLAKRVIVSLIVVVVVLIGILASGSQFYTDWLWYESLDLQQVFWTVLLWERAVPAAVWLVFAVFFFVNLRLTKNAVMQILWRNPQMAQLIKAGHVNVGFLAGSLLLGFLFAAGTSLFAFEAAKFFHAVPFGITDPIFGRDVAFYMFELPFYRFLLNLGIAFLVPTFIACAAIYGTSGHIQLKGFEVGGAKKALVHLSGLAAAFVFLRAIGYYFDVFEVMFSTAGAVYGPAFTDVHVRVLVFRVLAVIAALSGIVLLFGGSKRIPRFAAVLAVWLAVSVLGVGIIPGLVQSWFVEPSEFSREEPYIEHHIDMTQKAFGLDRFTQREFRGDQELDWDVLQENWDTIANIRLWDPRPLLLTYSQLQEMRLYYRFLDADIGRYVVDGQYRQVLLAARELDIAKIQNRTWINEHLQYTHGYGAVMSPVNEVSGQGLPVFWVSDIPPRSRIDITIDVPQIYFGERTNQYVIINTRADEFDYPMGDQNEFYRYTGDDGVAVSSFLRRIAFALRFGTSRILLSGEISNESRVLYYRNIHQRVQTLAPFLRFDQDPYLVVHEGRLVWVMDAYTTSDRFPYSQPYRGWGNYVRNSVKVVVDAYHGTVRFYQVEADPLLETYASIFPDLFHPIADMDPELREHIRYPEDFLTIQAQMYGTYHMSNTRVFYNREDVWTFANEMYSNREQPVVPYYVITQLPEEDRQEMILMVPFTPISRANMVAWLAARSDEPHYGEVIVYTFPKDSLTLGPAQIEARIDQDSEISQMLSLWGQRGSQVIRGNLLVVPIGDGLLYVEPLYLQSEQTGMPQLQRVIVAHQDDLVMEETLDLALLALFGDDIPEPLGEGLAIDLTEIRDTMALDVSDLPLRAQELYDEASEALRQGDFARFGEAWHELEEILMQWTETMQ